MKTTAGMPRAPAAAVFVRAVVDEHDLVGLEVQPLERPLEILGVRLDHAFKARNEIAVEPPEEIVNLDAPLPVLAFHVAERVTRHPCGLELGEHLHAAQDDAAYHLFGALAPSVDHLCVLGEPGPPLSTGLGYAPAAVLFGVPGGRTDVGEEVLHTLYVVAEQLAVEVPGVPVEEHTAQVQENRARLSSS